MKKLLLIIIICAFASSYASAWGKRNHAAIAYIAEQHLSPKAKATVNELLDGYSIITYASWLDYYRPEMLVKLNEPYKGKYTRTIPHSYKVDADFNALYIEGECMAVLDESIKKLQNYKELDDSTRTQCLWNIIHLVGDIHCPSHIRYEDKRDRKRGFFMVKSNGEYIKAHTMWDSIIIDASFPGGYIDLAYIADRYSKREIKSIQAGDVWDWSRENALICKDLWHIQEDEEIGSYYLYDHAHFALDRIAAAGYRLAKILNDLF